MRGLRSGASLRLAAPGTLPAILAAATILPIQNRLGLDARIWFETGLLGLSAFLVLIGALIAHTVCLWPQLDTGHRRIAAAALAGISALLTAGLFSFSYTSRQFALYLFLLFAILLALPAAQRR